jgi:hypothetical protein
MKAFVLGAGASKAVGYPLGSELFDEIDSFVRGSGRMIDRFNYHEDWPALCKWMESNTNPLIASAYRNRQLEHLFTELDMAEMLRLDGLAAVWRARKRGQTAAASAKEAWKALDKATNDYQRHRQVLLRALEQYLEFKHHSDASAEGGPQWDTLVKFGRNLRRGDFVITFNYDATLERVLWHERKWSPKDGYGFELVFRELVIPGIDASTVDLGTSSIKVLHLHGATGWYDKPVFRDGYVPSGAGFVATEDLSPAPFETPISLSSTFLQDLGVAAVDASLPMSPTVEPQILIHPTFLKNYEMERHGGSTDAFTDLWKVAARALREAEWVYIIGYSLPPADSAALTLLLTNCDRERVEIVNQDVAANHRLRSLLSSDTMGSPQSFEKWLDTFAD